uniref:FLYWCH-type domain-containing protein n=1 Tax=Meloidogyne hapla TaxID=6305 RepID=A0A1I8BNY7_MELHA
AMWLFLLSILINFYIVTPLSVFVKISWRENGENNQDYYQHLVNEEDERFLLELTGNNLAQPISGFTDIYDTFHFEYDDIYGEELNLQIIINGLNMYIGTVHNVENDSIIYIIPRSDKTKFIKQTLIEGQQVYFNTMIDLFKNLRVFLFIWDSPITSNNTLNIKIGCKDETNSNFITNFNSTGYEENVKYQTTNYIKTLVCPNDEYVVMFNEPEPTVTERGRPLLKLNGYTFVFDKLVEKKKFKAWGCKLIHECGARIRTDLNDNVLDGFMNVEHTHPPPFIKKQLTMVRKTSKFKNGRFLKKN